jgi:hypothetical protein
LCKNKPEKLLMLEQRKTIQDLMTKKESELLKPARIGRLLFLYKSAYR